MADAAHTRPPTTVPVVMETRAVYGKDGTTLNFMGEMVFSAQVAPPEQP